MIVFLRPPLSYLNIQYLNVSKKIEITNEKYFYFYLNEQYTTQLVS